MLDSQRLSDSLQLSDHIRLNIRPLLLEPLFLLEKLLDLLPSLLPMDPRINARKIYLGLVPFNLHNGPKILVIEVVPSSSLGLVPPQVL